jgi:hypothetical protein
MAKRKERIDDQAANPNTDNSEMFFAMKKYYSVPNDDEKLNAVNINFSDQ